MIELITNLPDNVVGFAASGQVSGDDYKTVIIPAVETAFGRHKKIRLLYHIGQEFKKFTTTALWDDARVGFHHLTGFERIAVVTDVGWIQTMARGVGLAMPGELRVFADAELEQAKVWIAA
jgi:hypothetical protein